MVVSAADLAGGRIDQVVRVKESLLGAERKIIDRAEQRAIVKHSSAQPDDRLTILERIVGDRDAWSKVVAILDDRFVFPAQAVTKNQIRTQAPVVLKEEPHVDVLLS